MVGGESDWDEAAALVGTYTPGLETGDDLLTVVTGCGYLCQIGAEEPVGLFGRGVAFGALFLPVGGRVIRGAAEEFLFDVARRAYDRIPGSGGTIGTLRHTYAKNLIDRYQRIFGDVGDGLSTEVAYLDGYVEKYGTNGSVRLDVVEGDKLNPIAVYDFKFGSAKLSVSRTNRIRKIAGLTISIPIIQIKWP